MKVDLRFGGIQNKNKFEKRLDTTEKCFSKKDITTNRIIFYEGEFNLLIRSLQKESGKDPKDDNRKIDGM